MPVAECGGLLNWGGCWANREGKQPPWQGPMCLASLASCVSLGKSSGKKVPQAPAPSPWSVSWGHQLVTKGYTRQPSWGFCLPCRVVRGVSCSSREFCVHKSMADLWLLEKGAAGGMHGVQPADIDLAQPHPTSRQLPVCCCQRPLQGEQTLFRYY